MDRPGGGSGGPFRALAPVKIMLRACFFCIPGARQRVYTLAVLSLCLDEDIVSSEGWGAGGLFPDKFLFSHRLRRTMG